MFFNKLLDDIELIDNKDIRDSAIFGLLQQVGFMLEEVTKLLKQGETHGEATKTI